MGGVISISSDRDPIRNQIAKLNQSGDEMKAELGMEIRIAMGIEIMLKLKLEYGLKWKRMGRYKEMMLLIQSR